MPESWAGEVCKGSDHRLLARAMAERGWLERGEGKNLARKVRVPGAGELRLYVIPAAFLAGGGRAMPIADLFARGFATIQPEWVGTGRSGRNSEHPQGSEAFRPGQPTVGTVGTATRRPRSRACSPPADARSQAPTRWRTRPS
jgi:hypothetical protein